jgi:hypothetical protein
MKFTPQQQREFIKLTRKTGAEWVDVFQGNTDYYATYYWDLLREMWFVNKPMMVSEALKSMQSVKSPFTARKHLQKAINGGLIIERKNPDDERSVLVELSPDLRAKLDKHFDRVLEYIVDLAETLRK